MTEEALQTAEGKEKQKAKEKRRHTQLNAELQSIAKRDKKDFLSEQ